MKKIMVVLFSIASMLVVQSCSQGQKTNETKTKEKISTKVKSVKNKRLSGTYVCTEHWNDALVDQIKMVFKNDSVSFSGIAGTTYRIKGDSLFVDMHKYEMGFVINGNNLTTTGPSGKVSYSKK